MLVYVMILNESGMFNKGHELSGHFNNFFAIQPQPADNYQRSVTCRVRQGEFNRF